MKCSNNTNDQSKKKHGSLNMKKDTVQKGLKEYEIKICLIGDDRVGKTSIASCFCKNSFTENYINSIGGAYQRKDVLLNNGVKMNLHIWTTRGQERFRSMTNFYYRDSQVAILVYDVTNEQSLESLSYWFREINDKVDQDNKLLCLAGNKIDVEPSKKKVPTIKGKEFAEQNNMIFFETSAKNGTGVKELFKAIAIKEYAIITENMQ